MGRIPLLVLLLSALACAAAAPASPLREALLRDGFARAPRALLPRAARGFRDAVLAAVAAEGAACAACSPNALASVDDELCFGCDHAYRDGAAARARSFSRARRLVEHNASLAALVHSRALARLAAAALGVDRVRLYQSTAFVKEPGDAPTAWHQDASAAPFANGDEIVTLWLALDDAPAACGPLRFLRASHAPGVPPPSLKSLPLQRRVRTWRRWSGVADASLVAATRLSIVEPPAAGLAAGDATIHSGWTLHAASANACAFARPALALTYFADSARLHSRLFRTAAEEGSGSGGSGGFVLPSFAGGSSGLFASTVEGGVDTGALRLATPDNSSALVVRLLADDASTWISWLRARPPVMIPGTAPKDAVLTPLLFDTADLESARGRGRDGEL